jgi:hypothetical protein
LKGLTENIGYAILILIMISTFATIAIEQVIGVGEVIRKETVQLTADRIESAVKSLTAVDEAKMELKMGGKNGYRIYTQNEEKYISYSYLNEEKTAKLENLNGVSYTVPRDRDDGKVDKICINKTSSISITGGVC